jgi:hypothetical protein
MTQDILQSDLDFARGLIRASHADAEIVAALMRRGVASAKASQVVNDLRLGKLVRPIDPILPEFASPHSPTERPESASDAELQPRPPAASRGAPRHAQSNNKKPRSLPIPRFVKVALIIMSATVCLGALYLAWLTNQRYHATTDALLDQWESAPAKDESLRARIAQRRFNASESARWNAANHPNAKTGASGFFTGAGLVLELQPDGLHIGQSLVTPGNACHTISEAIGPPTRTNRTDQPKSVIYAYDRHGLLVYSGEGAGDDSIMLDFDAQGGTNGTTLPFAGTLKFETNLIHADTDAGALAAIKKLGLSNPGNDTGTFRGRCNNLDLYFAYLKSSSRLSVIQINLKGPQ